MTISIVIQIYRLVYIDCSYIDYSYIDYLYIDYSRDEYLVTLIYNFVYKTIHIFIYIRNCIYILIKKANVYLT